VVHKNFGVEIAADFVCGIRVREERDMIIGYGRVSTDGQTLDAQIAQLKAAGAEKIFAEVLSLTGES